MQIPQNILKSPLYQKYQNEAYNLQQLKQQRAEKTKTRTSLDTQKNENELLLSEILLLDKESVIYKRTGSALIKQDFEETKVEIENRIKIINGQIKTIDNFLKTSEKKMQDKQLKLQEIQSKLIPQQGQQQQQTQQAVAQ